MYKRSYNGMLIAGISIIIVGLMLLTYCITSYSEIKTVTNKIDFDELDNNIRMSTSDKYYKYISIFDTLNQKLEKNKNLPIKNMSCAYLDYSQHNISSLYKLIYKNANEDEEKRSVVEEDIKSLIDLYGHYKSCRKTSDYQKELHEMLDEIDNSDDFYYQGRMETFVNGNNDIERVNQNGVNPQYSDQGIQQAPANNTIYQNTYPNNAQTQQMNTNTNQQSQNQNYYENSSQNYSNVPQIR